MHTRDVATDIYMYVVQVHAEAIDKQ